MSATFQTTALILRHRDEREVDKLISVLTPTRGKLTIRARGTKKSVSKLTGSLEPLSEVHLTLANGRATDVVTGSVIKRQWPKLRTDVVSLVAAQWLLELVDRVSKPGQPEQGLYPLVSDMLDAMEREIILPPGQRWVVLQRRAWQILAQEGFTPDWERCGKCHKLIDDDDDRVFEPIHGWLHTNEQTPEAWTVAPAVIAFLRDGQITVEQRQLFQELHRVVQRMIEHTLDRPLQSERVLRQLMRDPDLSGK